jgi:hypothetical protein
LKKILELISLSSSSTNNRVEQDLREGNFTPANFERLAAISAGLEGFKAEIGEIKEPISDTKSSCLKSRAYFNSQRY